MTDNALDEYRAARESQLVRNEARHIRSKINEARGSRQDAGGRWPFELLQNALDAGPRPGRDRVQVWLHQDGNTLTFEHDGAFFTMRELAALLSGGSSKDFDSEETTGRFGTGFLVTHVLAPRTTVKGILAREHELETFELTLDRGGDEDSIVANIEACDAAIRSAQPLAAARDVPSAAFCYVADDGHTLQRGIASFQNAVPYLFGTCDRLDRVTFADRGATEVWDAQPPTSRAVGIHLLHERRFRRQMLDQRIEYRAIRISSEETGAGALAVAVQESDGWRLLVPEPDAPRLFRRYPIRSSWFLPFNAILDAPFDVDQERRRILLDKPEVKALFSSAVAAIAPLVSVVFEEQWKERHRLARAGPCPSSFTDQEDEQEQAWITEQARVLARHLGQLPLVDTTKGPTPAVSVPEISWSASFLDPETDATLAERIWGLVNDAEGLYPPLPSVAAAWTQIARDWRALGVNVNFVTLASLARHVRGKATEVAQLAVRDDPRGWLVRFLDIAGVRWTEQRTLGDVLDGLLPNQRSLLAAPADLKRDGGIDERVKDIAGDFGLDLRSRLLDTSLLSIARERAFQHVEAVLTSVLPTCMTEDDALESCVRVLERRFTKAESLSGSSEPLVRASVALLDYLARSKGSAATALAGRVPLLAHDGTFARTSPQRTMMAPVATWDSRAQPFYRAYPPERILAPEYADLAVVNAAVDWGLVLSDLIARIAPSDPIKDERLKCLATDGQDTSDVHVQGEEFTQIALLHELIPRCQQRQEAAALLGLALCYAAPSDSGWREERVVTGRRSGADVPVTVRGALWLADLRARAWVRARSDEGRWSPVVPTAESLRSLLDPSWLHGNAPAQELLSQFFGFDALDLQLLAAFDEEKRQELRDRLAHIVALAYADPATLAAVETELHARQQRSREVNRCRTLGLAVQDAIKAALENHGLRVDVVDHGYDFDVSYDDIDDASSRLDVGSYLVEVKATTQGDAKLTPKQAEVASSTPDRFVLCVVDLRGIPIERLDQPWKPEDVSPLVHLVPQIGLRIQGTWQLVESARTRQVGVRNERALRYAVPPAAWDGGYAISDWVGVAFPAPPKQILGAS
jgi:hypothetical protein